MTRQPDATALTVEQPAPGASATNSAPGVADSDPFAGASNTSGAPPTTGPETADPPSLGRVQLTPLQESPSPRDAATRIPAVTAMAEPRAPRSALCALRRLRKQLCDLPPRVARAVARVRDAARRLRTGAVAKRVEEAGREGSHASSSGGDLMPILLSLNIVLLSVTIAMLLLQ